MATSNKTKRQINRLEKIKEINDDLSKKQIKNIDDQIEKLKQLSND